MDIRELTECVKPDGDDIIAEMMFQDLFGVSPAHESMSFETGHEIALKMLKHSGLFRERDTQFGKFFDGHFDIWGIPHELNVLLRANHQSGRFRVTLKATYWKFDTIRVKYERIGDNLANMLLDVLRLGFTEHGYRGNRPL